MEARDTRVKSPQKSSVDSEATMTPSNRGYGSDLPPALQRRLRRQRRIRRRWRKFANGCLWSALAVFLLSATMGCASLCSSLASDLSSDLSELDGSSPLAESAVMTEDELSAMSNTALTLFYVSLGLLGAGLVGHTVRAALPSGHEDEVRDQDLRDADEAAERSP